MFIRTCLMTLATATALVLSTSSTLFAVPTTVQYQDAQNADGTSHCDPLFIPNNVDEIGDPTFGFPTDESLGHFTTTVIEPVCLPTDDPTVGDALVGITNTTGRDLTDVWYVANNETRISNYDGYANDIGFAVDKNNETFRIDNDITDPTGKHHPLVFESGLANGIWESGETWHFILQDYSNSLGLLADDLTSIGVGDASFPVPGLKESSGSIIATPSVVPEPATFMLACMGLAGMFSTRRRRSSSACLMS